MQIRSMLVLSIGVMVICASTLVFAQDWIEFVSREERFSCVFPAQPQVTETTWTSEFGAILPARIYTTTQGQSRYSLTVADYNPIEQLMVEKSKSCPPGTETCQGVADWGLGYWKNDVRGAIVYATSKFLQSDIKVTLHDGRVMPGKIPVARLGVWMTPFLTTKTFSPEPSAT